MRMEGLSGRYTCVVSPVSCLSNCRIPIREKSHPTTPRRDCTTCILLLVKLQGQLPIKASWNEDTSVNRIHFGGPNVCTSHTITI